MYKIVNSLITGKQVSIKRLEDNAFIPFDPANTDYQAYLKYVAEGGIVLPAEGTN